MKAVPVKLVIPITIIYIILHCTLFSAYTLPKEQTPTSYYISLLQWLIPAAFGLFYVAFPKIIDRINVRVEPITWLLLVGVLLFTVMNLAGIQGIWFSWSTIALICLLMLVMLTFNSKMKGIDNLLTSVFMILLSFGLWEIVYQTGVLAFYDFFGTDHRNYVVTLLMLMCWIEPGIIILAFMQRKYHMIHINKYVVICGIIFAIATVIWYTTGFAIPVIWQKTIPVATNANETLIAVSRCSQAFFNLGLALGLRTK